jgi:hypothetical protein
MAKEGAQGRLLRIAKTLRPNVLVKALSGAAVLWTFLPDDGSPAATIHHAFRREEWREAGFGGRLLLWGGFLLSGPATLVLLVACTARCGRRVRSETGKGLARQMLEQSWLACSAAVQPPWYYAFELYEDSRRARAMEYLYRAETKRALYEFLRVHLASAETTDALADKAHFAARCGEHALPVVAVLAKAARGSIAGIDGSGGGLPPKSLFLKPTHGTGGRGASRWIYEHGAYVGDKGTTFTEAQLVAHIVHLSESEPYVVREYVTNHRAIADLSAGALSTVRVLTCTDEHGRPEATHAVLRMASNRDVVVDNFHAGGVAASVDVRTGKLGRATDMGLGKDTRWWDVHPVTGARIQGRVLPFWNEVLALARRAHEAFADHVAIGWDIALLQNGPHLVEGNKSPDLDIIQRCYREPAGNSRFGELFAFHVRRTLDESYAMKVDADIARTNDELRV